MEKFEQLFLLLFLINNYNGIFGIENESSAAYPNKLPTTFSQNDYITTRDEPVVSNNISSNYGPLYTSEPTNATKRNSKHVEQNIPTFMFDCLLNSSKTKNPDLIKTSYLPNPQQQKINETEIVNKRLANFHVLPQSNMSLPEISETSEIKNTPPKNDRNRNNGDFNANDKNLTEFERNSTARKKQHNSTNEAELASYRTENFYNLSQTNDSCPIKHKIIQRNVTGMIESKIISASKLQEATKERENVSGDLILTHNTNVNNIPKELERNLTEKGLSGVQNYRNMNNFEWANKLNRNFNTLLQTNTHVLKTLVKSQVPENRKYVTLAPKLEMNENNGSSNYTLNRSTNVNNSASELEKNLTKREFLLPPYSNYLANYLHLLGKSSKPVKKLKREEALVPKNGTLQTTSIKNAIKSTLVPNDKKLKNNKFSSTPTAKTVHSNTLNSKFIRSIEGKRVLERHNTFVVDNPFSPSILQNLDDGQHYNFPQAILEVVETAPFILHFINHKNKTTHICPNFHQHLEDYLVIMFDFSKCLRHVMNPENPANEGFGSVCQSIRNNYTRIMSLMKVIRGCVYHTLEPINESKYKHLETKELTNNSVERKEESNYTQVDHPNIILNESVNDKLSANNSTSINPTIDVNDTNAQNSRTRSSRNVEKYYQENSTRNLKEGMHKNIINHNNAPLEISDIASLKTVNEHLEHLRVTISNYAADHNIESCSLASAGKQTERFNVDVIPSSIPLFTFSPSKTPESVDIANKLSEQVNKRETNGTELNLNNLTQSLDIDPTLYINNLNITNFINITEGKNLSNASNMSMAADYIAPHDYSEDSKIVDGTNKGLKLSSGNITVEPNITTTVFTYPSINKTHFRLILENTDNIRNDTKQTENQATTENFSTVNEINQYKQIIEPLITTSTTEFVNATEISTERSKNDNVTLFRSRRHAGSEMIGVSFDIPLEPNFTYPVTNESNFGVKLNDTNSLKMSTTKPDNEMSTENGSFVEEINQHKSKNDHDTLNKSRHVVIIEICENNTLEPDFSNSNFTFSITNDTHLEESFDKSNFPNYTKQIQKKSVTENPSSIDKFNRQIMKNVAETITATKLRSKKYKNNRNRPTLLKNHRYVRSEVDKILEPYQLDNMVGNMMDTYVESVTESKSGAEEQDSLLFSDLVNEINKMKNMMHDADDISKIENVQMIPNISVRGGENELLKSLGFHMDEPQNMRNIDMEVDNTNEKLEPKKSSDTSSFYYYTITLPTFFGLIVGIAVLCLVLRTGGWCCNLLREQPQPLAEEPSEEEGNEKLRQGEQERTTEEEGNEKLRRGSGGDNKTTTNIKKPQTV